MRELAVRTKNLTKIFPGEIAAVSGLDLEVERGKVFGLVGRNGAGKTTTLRLLMGLLLPSRGEAEVFGKNLRKANHRDRSRVCYVSQSQQLPRALTLRELCRSTARFYPRWDEDRAQELVRRWRLSWDKPIGECSGGEQRRFAIVLALAPRPEALLLDEPAAGLDPIARRELLEELIHLLGSDEGCTVIFSTHLLTDLERISECIGILDRGRLVVSARLDDLQTRMQRVQVIFPGEMVPTHFGIPGAPRTKVSGPVATGVTQHLDGEHLDALRRWPGARVQVFPLNLEEIFCEFAGRTEPDNDGAELELEDREGVSYFN